MNAVVGLGLKFFSTTAGMTDTKTIPSFQYLSLRNTKVFLQNFSPHLTKILKCEISEDKQPYKSKK